MRQRAWHQGEWAISGLDFYAGEASKLSRLVLDTYYCISVAQTHAGAAVYSGIAYAGEYTEPVSFQ